MNQLANPLHYPLAVLAGGIFLIAGVRLVRLPSVVAIPGAAAIATAGAAVLKTREPATIELDNPALSKELQAVRQQAQKLTQTADLLKTEATQVLTNAHQMELLGTVQYACDRTDALPAQIDQLARRMQGKDSLLSVADLEKQLQDVQAKIQSNSGVAQIQWQNLAQRLERNIALAQQGEDTRQAQLAQLSTLIAEAGGVLQQLQNKLRTTDFTSAVATEELRELSDEFKGVQESVEVLVG
ncbi:MAG: hypothetical protein AAF152_04655 [Cyanobacteria bacterium P01_A01_bin.114]